MRRDALSISDVVPEEIAKAPGDLRLFPEKLVKEVPPMALSESPETVVLADAYVASQVVPSRFRDDARHVAVASVAGVEALVSWNFRHLVNLRKKRLIHCVSVRFGYPQIDLVSPEEVLYG